jgi:hypothetical protein
VQVLIVRFIAALAAYAAVTAGIGYWLLHVYDQQERWRMAQRAICERNTDYESRAACLVVPEGRFDQWLQARWDKSVAACRMPGMDYRTCMSGTYPPGAGRIE